MLRATIVLFLLTLSRSWAADVTTLQDPNSGLYSWKVVDRGFSLELVQLPPDFIRAVYAARDLPPAMIEEVAGYCAFGSIARNETKSPLSYRVADWRAETPDGTRHRLRTKTEWLNHWKKMGRGFEVPVTPGVQLHDLLTVQLGAGTLDHVVNDTGFQPFSSLPEVASWSPTTRPSTSR